MDELIETDVEGRRAFQIMVEVMVDFDSDTTPDPPAAQVRQDIAIEDNAVVVVTATAAYEEAVGAEVFEPLLVDGLDLVAAGSG